MTVSRHAGLCWRARASERERATRNGAGPQLLRERTKPELLKLMVEGHHYKTAAQVLGISPNTISFHLKHI